MRLLKSETTRDAYHGAAPEIEVTVRSEEAYDEMLHAVREMNNRRVKRGGSRVEYLIRLIE